jgi:fructose-1,6-bisphosphatase
MKSMKPQRAAKPVTPAPVADASPTPLLLPEAGRKLIPCTVTLPPPAPHRPLRDPDCSLAKVSQEFLTPVGEHCWLCTLNRQLAHAVDRLALAAKEWHAEILPWGRRASYLLGAQNETRDMVTDLDLASSKLFVERLKRAGFVVLTEETVGSEQPLHCRAALRIAVDPFDGSSLSLGPTGPVGMLAGIFAPNVNHWSGKDLLASMSVVVGREIEMRVAYRGFGTFAFVRNPDPASDWSLSSASPGFLSPEAKYLHLGGKLKDYPQELLATLVSLGCSSAYFRCLAQDLHFMLGISGGSAFVYPQPRLRLVYELLPVALLVEESGGACYFLQSDGSALTRNEIRVHNSWPHDISAVVFGSKHTVEEIVTAAGYLFDTTD